MMLYANDSETADTRQLARDIALLHAFVQGAASETVTLGGVATPTLRALAASVQSGAARLLARAEAFEARVARLEAILEGMGLDVSDAGGVSSVTPLGGLARKE